MVETISVAIAIFNANGLRISINMPSNNKPSLQTSCSMASIISVDGGIPILVAACDLNATSTKLKTDMEKPIPPMTKRITANTVVAVCFTPGD